MELKPCPFCGGEAYLKNDGTICCYVTCSKCHAGTRLYGDGLTACAAWNRRPKAEINGKTRWIQISEEPYNIWQCRNCGCRREKVYPPNFCENCGAKTIREEMK